MATDEYRYWNSRGRPWRLALPIQQFVDMARAQGIPILGTIGNEAHLTDDYPEDHTPFSRTAWPNILPGYIVTACDIADGPWSDRILAFAKSGVLPQVKYLNFRGSQYNVKTDWQRRNNSDKHLHISIRTDHLNTPLSVNPFTSVQAPAPARKGRRPMILGKTKSNATVWLGNGWNSKALTSMDQANRWASAGAVWAEYPDDATMFADIGAPGNPLDRIEALLKSPAAVSLTMEQLTFLGGTVTNAVLDALTELGKRLFAAAKP